MEPVRGNYWPAVALVAAALLPILFPGDAPFINNEPELISLALTANQEHRLAEMALQGNRGAFYGPFPVWIYQALVAVTHNLKVIVVLRALLVGSVTAWALWSISRRLDLWRWFAPIALISPYFWYYARHLWDNSFGIPLSAVAVAAYASFLDRRSALSIAVVIGCIWALVFTHLMALALIIPLGLHMLAFARRSLWHSKWVVVAVSVIAVLAGFPYCRYLVRGGFQSAEAVHSVAGWVFPLLGPRVLSAQGLRYFFTPEWRLGEGGVAAVLGTVATIVSCISFPLVWIGIGLAAHLVARGLRRPEAMTTREKIYSLVLATLCAQILLNGITGTARHPHYFNATWIIFVLLAWLTVDAASKRRLAPWIALPYASAQLLAIGLLWFQIHANGGTRAGFGPTIANQMDVAADLNRYSTESRLEIAVLNYQLFPHALQALLQLEPAPSGQPLPRADLAIVYASSDPRDGRIKLVLR
jgi:hypothetical protein